MKQDYPRLAARGTVIVGDDPPGIGGLEIKRVLSPEEFQAWCNWSYGITCGPDGVYPWDLEDFLAGRPNLD